MSRDDMTFSLLQFKPLTSLTNTGFLFMGSIPFQIVGKLSPMLFLHMSLHMSSHVSQSL